jgi:hypothetical protein
MCENYTSDDAICGIYLFLAQRKGILIGEEHSLIFTYVYEN